MMEQKALIQNILEELADYGKYKGVALLENDDYIPVRAARRIVRQNVKGIRYDWEREEPQGFVPEILEKSALDICGMLNCEGGPEALQAMAREMRRMQSRYERKKADAGGTPAPAAGTEGE